MDMKRLLEKVAEEFDLKFNFRNKFKSIVLTKREIVIRNFLGGCPDPLYVKHGNKDRNRIGINLIKFIHTEDYRKDVSKPHACVISPKEIKEELRLISNIADKNIKAEVENLYSKVKKKIGNAKRLTLIWKPASVKEAKGQMRKEITLHEFVHELLDDNKIRLKSWKWNEGLVTYITNFVLNKHKKFEDSPPLGTSKMWNIYARYTHRWAKLLKNAKNSKERKKIVLQKIRKVDKKKNK